MNTLKTIFLSLAITFILGCSGKTADEEKKALEKQEIAASDSLSTELDKEIKEIEKQTDEVEQNVDELLKDI